MAEILSRAAGMLLEYVRDDDTEFAIVAELLNAPGVEHAVARQQARNAVLELLERRQVVIGRPRGAAPFHVFCASVDEFTDALWEQCWPTDRSPTLKDNMWLGRAGG